jgi:fused signal recognition particle receptor
MKETLESYSDDELDRIIALLGLPAKKDDSAGKMGRILKQPLEKVNNVLYDFAKEEFLESGGEVDDDSKREERKEEKTSVKAEDKKASSKASKVKELDEIGAELPTPDDIQKVKKPESAEDAEEKDAERSKDENKEKKGFFSRLFGKKKDDEGLKEEEKEDKKEKKKDVKKTDKEEELDQEIESVEEEIAAEEKVVEKDEQEEEELKKEGEKVFKPSKEDKPAQASKKEAVAQESDDEDDEDDSGDDDSDEEESESSTGFFGKIKEKIAGKKLSASKFEEIFFELEVVLMENNVAVEVIERIKSDLKVELVDKTLNRFEIDNVINKTLKRSIDSILSFKPVDILGRVKEKRAQKLPFVIVFVGINGSGKTTTIAKVAKYFMNNDLKVVMVAADTFRAAAIQQLEEHANKLGVRMIKHDYGSDPAAVAFDGIKYAESKGVDVVLIDTAGRLHSNTNLMDEMKKIIRVSKPDMKIFIGESITGNDCIEQAQKFNEAIELDGIVLSKADVDEKGGAALSVSYVTGKPILFFGVGQTYDDLQAFDKKKVMAHLGM